MKIHFLTLFPEVLEPFFKSSLMGKACLSGRVNVYFHQIRDSALDSHRTVDDTPYGGGEGMVLKADVLHGAWLGAGGTLKSSDREGQTSSTLKQCTLLLSPQGKLLDHALADELGQYDQLILVCGHYEGVDERFVETCVDREISIGDYVLTGGELPALVLAETIIRRLKGVVGNEASVQKDSLSGGLLKYPQYTRPRTFEGLSVPEVLTGGNHAEIERWRQAQKLERTRLKRPDLWAKKASNVK